MLSGCAGDDEDEAPAGASPVASEPAARSQPTGPPVGEAAAATTAGQSPLEDPGAAEASPEAGPEGVGETSELASGDEATVTEAVRSYVAALNRGDAAAVCGLLEPGALALRELPVRRGGCVRSLAASVGHRRKGGAPAWKHTEIVELTAVSVGDGRARVTATVTHDFADRRYASIEEDVVYLDRDPRGRWLLAKPSGTLYRAVGYPQPPLRALTPPP
jgi:ketosteroid isomerase-like protein